MIRIIYTGDRVENEPGPNLYWRGEPQDFLKLVLDLHELGRNNNVEMEMMNFDYVKIIDEYSVKVKSSINGTSLVSVTGKTILIDCKNDIWRDILALFLSISFYPCHHYIEFDEVKLIEDANFVISSEGEF